MGSRAAEAVAPTGHHQLHRRLAGAVGIVAAEAIVLPIPPLPFAVGIHLVGCD